MKKIVTLAVFGILSFSGFAQEKLWTEAERKYLLENLIRSRDELKKETEKLSEKQWRFKESPDRWSINEVVEHLAIYEMLFDRQISQSLSGDPQPELNASSKHDSTFYNFIMENKPHVTSDYTKPFTYGNPMGLNDLKNNISWFVKMRNESIDYVKSTTDDLRAFYLTSGRPNVHQVYIYAFGHVDRGLRQIRKIKKHANYPK
jgi:hypothetical protein